MISTLNLRTVRQLPALTGALILLASCTTTTVHLYTEGMDESTLATVESSLQKDGFDVKRNARPVPREVTRPTLVYAHEHQKPVQLNKLDASLHKLEYDPRWVPVSIGNNFYTKNNVGLYLVPYADIDHSQSPDVELNNNWFSNNDFVSACEDLQAYLVLRPDYTYQLDVYEPDPDSGRNAINSNTGLWQQEGDSIQMLYEGRAVFFEQEEITGQLQVQERQIPVRSVHLHNQGEEFSGCDFIFTENISL